MNLKGFLKYSVVIGAFMLPSVGCQKFLDVNQDPNAVVDAPIEQVFTSATVSLGFFAGSDMHRYSALLTQQLSGQGAGTNQTQEYERYNIQGSDLNNAWGSAYHVILADLELVIQKATKENSPHYAGCAKIMKAYMFSLLADVWGQIPFTEALKFTANLKPKFDDASTVYPALIALLDEAIVDLKSATSVKSPAANSTIFTGAWAGSKIKWEATANALKARLWLHTSKVDKANAASKIAALAAAANTNMTAITDNFEMPFVSVSRQQNPIHQFEVDRANNLFANATMINMMNAKVDPRRPRYFTQFPHLSGQYVGAKCGDLISQKYSRMHIYLRGDATNAPAAQPDGSLASTAYVYTGMAPIRILTYAELQFIRAEAAVLGNAAIAGISADSFFRSGIRASMAQAGVTADAANAYIYAGNGTLAGTEAENVKKIIEEKFVANFGIAMEPWSDWRRTGVPTLPIPANALVPTTPRSFFYPQNEIDLNPNAPKQKADMTVRVFWDK